MSKYSELAERLIAHPEHWEFINLRKEATAALRELEAERDKLLSLLYKYGSHTSLCNFHKSMPSNFEPCDCGWPDVMKKLRDRGDM